MAVPASTRPQLRVIDGGWQSEEADIESVAFMDEVAADMAELIDFASRVVRRAQLARTEVLRLRGGGDAA